MRNLHALLRSAGFKCLFGIVYRLRNFRLLKRLKMKNPPSSQTADNSHKPKTLKLN